MDRNWLAKKQRDERADDVPAGLGTRVPVRTQIERIEGDERRAHSLRADFEAVWTHSLRTLPVLRNQPI
jgi:hypothetical protein